MTATNPICARPTEQCGDVGELTIGFVMRMTLATDIPRLRPLQRKGDLLVPVPRLLMFQLLAPTGCLCAAR